jgi:acetoacetate decarboxylase
MTRDEILQTPSVPAFAPSYLHGPFRFVQREYLIITYGTDPNILHAALPEPLEPAPGNLACYESMNMPDACGFGDYQESGTGVQALWRANRSFSLQMHVDDEPPIADGREIWGFPKKYGIPHLKAVKDTLTGTPHHDDERVAMGTMKYKARSLGDRLDTVKTGLGTLNVSLKLLPNVDGKPKIAQIVGYNLEDIHLHGTWDEEARIHFIPQVNCRVADLPIRRIVGGRYQIVDFVLPYGRALRDYLA